MLDYWNAEPAEAIDRHALDANVQRWTTRSALCEIVGRSIRTCKSIAANIYPAGMVEVLHSPAVATVQVIAAASAAGNLSTYGSSCIPGLPPM